MRSLPLTLIFLWIAVARGAAQQPGLDAKAGFGNASRHNLEAMAANPARVSTPARETPRYPAQRDAAFRAHVQGAANVRRAPLSIRTND